MDLVPNSTFRLLAQPRPTTPHAPGIYRVIFGDPVSGEIIAVLIQSEEPAKKGQGGRPQQEFVRRPRKTPRPPLVGKLVWMIREDLQELEGEKALVPIQIERQSSAYVRPHSQTGEDQYVRRIEVMGGFLDPLNLQESIIVHRSLGGLVDEATKRTGCSRAYVYRLWSLLCKFGITATSLKTMHEKCGAKGKARPVDPGGRKKAGRKTLEQNIARVYGVHIDARQPGMSTEWAAAVRAADKLIAEPKPSWSKRCVIIVKSAFIGQAIEENGRITLIKPAIGTYPNDAQIRRVLTVEKSRLLLLLERTTKHHFKSARRGLVARNWQGVSGPGHTWAIDSTVGDIYLRSSIDRSWVVGRPIVYVIVDVWSTAVVGFHVCLTGPSWATAKLSLFNATADPALIGDLWGYEPMLPLNPRPTMCYCLLCDRGEYLSSGHRETAMKFLPLTSYTPPYRGDLKGLAEVLHRIEKDEQFFFIPGAMDYRRKELELRRVNPNDCVLTTREYVQFLHELFAEYNLTAQRRHRVDGHMEAAGVLPSPAGLWSFGHQMGIGFRQHIEEADLITHLLPTGSARVRRDAIRFMQCDFSSKEVNEEQWTAIARNFGGWDVPVHHYGGSMSRIWTPAPGRAGLMSLSLRDESKISPEATQEEYLDTLAHATMRQPEVDHMRKMLKMDFLRSRSELIQRATQKTAQALAKGSGESPTMTEARAMENGAIHAGLQPESEMAHAVANDTAMSAYEAMLGTLLRAADAGGE